MKLLFILLTAISLTSLGQDAGVMEKKARELHRVISLDDRDQWTKFIRENYTPALIAKPVTGHISAPGGDVSLADATKGSTDVGAKAILLARLHQDFGNSRIVSIKPDKDNLKMVLNNNEGLTGTFDLTFDKNNMIDKFGVMAGN